VFGTSRTTKNKGSPLKPLSEDLSRLFTIKASTEEEARGLLDELQHDELVTDVYIAPPRHLYPRVTGAQASSTTGTVTPKDRWDLEMIGFFRAEKAKLLPDARSVLVAVVDSGVDANHPDLKEAVEEALNFTGASDDDESGHGTHVMGIIAGRGCEPSGMRGVSNAKILSIKALDPYDPTQYYRALGEAADRAKIINLSLGGPEDIAETLIIQSALARGVIIVAAMGNEYEFGNPQTYPAAIGGVIAVGAVSQSGTRAEFSNCGPYIHLVAPGVNIVSTIPMNGGHLFKGASNYGTSDGTSMATPFVTGAIALIKAQNPELTPSEIIAVLRAKLLSTESGSSEEYGIGLLDLEATLQQSSLAKERQEAKAGSGGK
jgi:subtilisin family serine protease